MTDQTSAALQDIQSGTHRTPLIRGALATWLKSLGLEPAHPWSLLGKKPTSHPRWMEVWALTSPRPTWAASVPTMQDETAQAMHSPNCMCQVYCVHQSPKGSSRSCQGCQQLNKTRSGNTYPNAVSGRAPPADCQRAACGILTSPTGQGLQLPPTGKCHKTKQPP